MTATTRISAGTSTRPRPRTIGFANLLRSEWTKLRSVRSTYGTACIAVLACIALGILICARTAYNINHGVQSADGLDSTLTSLTSLNGVYVAQVAIGALGVLTISSEYSTGMIRATSPPAPSATPCSPRKGLSSPPPP